MSERGSWEPFGPGDDDPPPPPLAPGDPLEAPRATPPPPTTSLWSEPEPEPRAAVTPSPPQPPPPQPPSPSPPSPAPQSPAPPVQWQAPPSVGAGWNPPSPETYGWSGITPRGGGTSGKAVTAFVLAIVGLFMCPVIGSIAALLVAAGARGELRDNPALQGRGLARAAAVAGWMGLLFYGLLFLLMLIGVAAGP